MTKLFEIQHLRNTGTGWTGPISQEPVNNDADVQAEAAACAQAAIGNGAERVIVSMDGEAVFDSLDHAPQIPSRYGRHSI